MEEKIITGHKNGMLVLLLELVLYIAAVVFLIVGINAGFLPLVVLCVILLLLGWIPLCGLRVLKPQEALVLTLFGKYIGTLKGEGFYLVNPFCSSFNPAAKTKLNQTGDVDGGHKGTDLLAAMQGASAAVEVGGSKKISLKIMTLNNTRQKINDCLGNPVEIGIAVMWRVTDTAKAVFNVDNYKEYLSLQCDAALRNIVRIYPYDVAPNVDTTGRRSWPTRAACVAPARSSPRASAMKFRPRSPTRALRSSKRASPISPTRPRSRPSCSSASRPAPSSTRAR